MKKNYLPKKLVLTFLLLSFLLVSTLDIQTNAQGTEAGSSLYERLGGVNSIAAVVDDFVDRLLTNPTITANKNVVAGLAHITKPGLKFLLTELVCEKAGGPQKYTGRSMKESHKDLNISEAEWEAMQKEFLESLKKFSVPNKEQIELVVIVGSTKGDIVTKTEKAPAAPQAAPPGESAAPPSQAPPSPQAAPPPAAPIGIPPAAPPAGLPPPAPPPQVEDKPQPVVPVVPVIPQQAAPALPAPDTEPAIQPSGEMLEAEDLDVEFDEGN